MDASELDELIDTFDEIMLNSDDLRAISNCTKRVRGAFADLRQQLAAATSRAADPETALIACDQGRDEWKRRALAAEQMQDTLRAALAWYADPANYVQWGMQIGGYEPSDADKDNGRKARAVLDVEPDGKTPKGATQ